MTKGFKKVSTEVPMEDIKSALALMRFRTALPTKDSLAYASISACAHELSISYEKTRLLLKQIVSENTSQQLQNQINTRSNRLNKMSSYRKTRKLDA